MERKRDEEERGEKQRKEKGKRDEEKTTKKSKKREREEETIRRGEMRGEKIDGGEKERETMAPRSIQWHRLSRGRWEIEKKRGRDTKLRDFHSSIPKYSTDKKKPLAFRWCANFPTRYVRDPPARSCAPTLRFHPSLSPLSFTTIYSPTTRFLPHFAGSGREFVTGLAIGRHRVEETVRRRAASSVHSLTTSTTASAGKIMS